MTPSEARQAKKEAAIALLPSIEQMIRTRGLDDVIRMVREHAARTPDKVYHACGGACAYTPDTRNPEGCIIGAAFRDIGINLNPYDDGDVGPGISAIFTRVFPVEEGKKRDERLQSQIVWLSRVQQYQDGMSSWGTAVAMADSAILKEAGVK